MKKNPFILLVAAILLSCGASTASKSPGSSPKDSSDSKTPASEFTYSLDFNNKNSFLGYGSILSKPFDTIMSPDTLWFFANKKLVYTETSMDSYFFYKKNKHWPKQFELADGRYIFLIERSVGEPEGSDIVGFIFNNGKFDKKVEMKTYKWWTFQGDKDYSIEELKKITGTNQL